MIVQYTKLMAILLLVLATWCNEAVANPTFDGYHYEKPSVPFDYPTATKLMPKTLMVVTKPTPTKEESVKVETKPKQTVVASIQNKENEMKTIEKTPQSTEIRTTINNKDLSSDSTTIKHKDINSDSNKTIKSITLIKTKTEQHHLNSNIITGNHQDGHNHHQKLIKPGHSLEEKHINGDLSDNIKPNTLTKTKCENQQHNNHDHHNHHNHHRLKPGHSLEDALHANLIHNKESTAQAPQQYHYNKPEQTDDLEKFLNRDNEFIYRLSTNVGKHPIVTHHESADEHNPHHHHGAVKRLKLKHGFLGVLHSNNTGACCDQNIESLKLKFSERSRNRPLERRLSPYTETIIDKEYFE